jgi:septal ring factor EnvC (AmiA/AmiB activator)
MQNKIITVTDLAIAVEEAAEKVEVALKALSKRIDKIEAALALEDSQKESLDERVTRIEKELGKLKGRSYPDKTPGIEKEVNKIKKKLYLKK